MTYTEFNELYNVAMDYLDEYQQRAMNDAVNAFGFEPTTVDNMLVLWYGECLESFVDDCLGE